MGPTGPRAGQCLHPAEPDVRPPKRRSGFGNDSGGTIIFWPLAASAQRVANLGSVMGSDRG